MYQGVFSCVDRTAKNNDNINLWKKNIKNLLCRENKNNKIKTSFKIK